MNIFLQLRNVSLRTAHNKYKRLWYNSFETLMSPQPKSYFYIYIKSPRYLFPLVHLHPSPSSPSSLYQSLSSLSLAARSSSLSNPVLPGQWVNKNLRYLISVDSRSVICLSDGLIVLRLLALSRTSSFLLSLVSTHSFTPEPNFSSLSISPTLFTTNPSVTNCDDVCLFNWNNK